MVNKFIKGMILIMCSLISTLFFIACTNDPLPYNAQIYDSCSTWFKEDFKKKNRIKSAYYYDGDVNDYPETRTFVINDANTFNNIIVDDFKEIEVNFDVEMIVIYTFSTDYTVPVKIANIKMTDDGLEINYIIELKANAGGAVSRYQRWVVVKMDKLNVTTVTNSLDEITIY